MHTYSKKFLPNFIPFRFESLRFFEEVTMCSNMRSVPGLKRFKSRERTKGVKIWIYTDD